MKNVKCASILSDRGVYSGDDEDLNSRDHDYRADTVAIVAILITIQLIFLDLAWERRSFELHGGKLSRMSNEFML